MNRKERRAAKSDRKEMPPFCIGYGDGTDGSFVVAFCPLPTVSDKQIEVTVPAGASADVRSHVFIEMLGATLREGQRVMVCFEGEHEARRYMSDLLKLPGLRRNFVTKGLRLPRGMEDFVLLSEPPKRAQ